MQKIMPADEKLKNSLIRIIDEKLYRNLDKFNIKNYEKPNFIEQSLNFLLYFACYLFINTENRKIKRHHLNVDKYGLFKPATNKDNSATFGDVVEIARLLKKL